MHLLYISKVHTAVIFRAAQSFLGGPEKNPLCGHAPKTTGANCLSCPLLRPPLAGAPAHISAAITKLMPVKLDISTFSSSQGSFPLIAKPNSQATLLFSLVSAVIWSLKFIRDIG